METTDKIFKNVETVTTLFKNCLQSKQTEEGKKDAFIKAAHRALCYVCRPEADLYVHMVAHEENVPDELRSKLFMQKAEIVAALAIATMQCGVAGQFTVSDLENSYIESVVELAKMEQSVWQSVQEKIAEIATNGR